MKSKKRNWSTFALVVGLGHATFGWAWLDYPSYSAGRCYSPNGAFYITGRQTLWEHLTTKYPGIKGTVRLFDKSGTLLYEDDTILDADKGPHWSAGIPGDPHYPPKVFFMDHREPGWTFTLPSSPGHPLNNAVCY